MATIGTWTLAFVYLEGGAILAILLGGLAALLGDRKRIVAQAIIAQAFRMIPRSLRNYPYRLSGLENLPSGPCLLCPNHQSIADVVYLFTLPVGFRIVVKKEMFSVPLIGTAVRLARYPCIDRGDADSAKALLQTTADLLKDGLAVLTFPEGTRSCDGEVGPFNSGPARLALHCGVPLVPIGVVGTERVLPKGSLRYAGHARLAIHVGPPIPTGGAPAYSARKLTKQLRQAVLEAKAEAARLQQRLK